MPEEKYSIPVSPQYSEDIRKLQDNDPASASQIFNPLFERIIENIASIYQAVRKAVPTTTTVNGKPLNGNIQLTAEDVKARPNTWTPTASDVGALPSGGTAAAATKLATSRTIRTNLGSTGTANFDGTANVTPGVTGVLPVANGGTGQTSLSDLAASIASYVPPLGVLKTFVLSTSGSWTVPSDVLGNIILVYRMGGGGGGGGSNRASSSSSFSSGAGGGGSGYIKADLLQVTSGRKLSYSIGAGGLGGSGAGNTGSGEDGHDGGATTFSGLESALGGKGGRNSGTGGAGYSGGGGGGRGGSSSVSGSRGGDGGSYGGNGSVGTNGSAGGSGVGHTIYSGAEGSSAPSDYGYGGGGGGGGGGLTANGKTFGTGGNGANGTNSTYTGKDGEDGESGVVIIQYYVKGT